LAGRPKAASVVLFSEPSKRLSHIGNGVLLQLGDNHFVLTAAHVIDRLRTESNSILLRLADGLLPFAGEWVVNELPPGATREQDPIDIGVLRITRSIPAHVAAGALTVSDLDPSAPTDGRAARTEPRAYTVLGAPAKRSNSDFKKRQVTAKLNRYAAPEAEWIYYDIVRRQRSKHVVLDWEEKHIGVGGVVRGPLAFNGVSGAGIWRLTTDAERAAGRENKLVAIFTDHIRTPLGLLVGRRIRDHLRVIADRWPDAATHLRDIGL